MTITTSNGTTVSIKDDGHGERVVVLENDTVPAHMRRTEAGRVVDVDGVGFQPHPFAAWALRPEALRAIADLLEAEPEVHRG
jgi:hypothetical protein